MGFLCKLFWCKLLHKHNPTVAPSGRRNCIDCGKELDKNNKPIPSKSRKQIRFENFEHLTRES